jgi:hypothetical protein
MANCTPIEGLSKSCDNNLGGIREFYVWDIEDQTSFVEDDATWNITELIAATAPSGFEFTRNSSNYTEETAAELTNGSTVVTQTVNLMFSRREALKSRSIKVLGEGQRYLGAIVKDYNDTYWVFQDLQLTATGEGSGTAKADGSKYSVTLLGEVKYLAKEIDSTLAEAFISTGTTV